MTLARGSPDYWPVRLAGVDWLKTVLATWTEYGPTVAEATQAAVASNALTLMEKTNPALFRGAVLRSLGAATCANDYFRLTIDGTVVFDDTFQDLLDNWIVFDQGSSQFLVCFDEVNCRFTLCVRSGFDYNTQCKIEYIETYGRTPALEAVLIYAEIPT